MGPNLKVYMREAVWPAKTPGAYLAINMFWIGPLSI